MVDEKVLSKVKESALKHGLPWPLVAAIVSVESGGAFWAMRAEPGYRWLWDEPANKPFRRLSSDEAQEGQPPSDFAGPGGASRATEWWGQKTSWGLMQVMGAVARELGYKKPFLSGLCCPDDGLEIGCKLLVRLKKKYRGNLLDAISAYNQGSNRKQESGDYRNQRYVDKVVAEAWKLGHLIEPT